MKKNGTRKHWWTVCAVLFWFILVQTGWVFGAPQDDLWLNAVGIAEENQGWIPGVTTIINQSLDRKGKTTSSTEMSIKTSLAEDGTLKRELAGGMFPGGAGDQGGFGGRGNFSGQRPQQNQQGDSGQNAPNQQRQPGQHGQQGGQNPMMGQMFGAQFSPFSKDTQDSITIERTAKTERVTGKSCVVYEFVMSGGEQPVSGRAWLEQNSGVPVKVALDTVKNEQLGADVTTEMYYTSNENGDWYPNAIVTIRETKKLVLFKEQTRLTMKFTDYFRMPAASGNR